MFTIVKNRLFNFVKNNSVHLLTIAELHQLFSSHKAKELYGRYIPLESIEPLINKLNDTFKVSVIGYSVKKRPIYSVVIGSGSRKILMWSQMHGNESTTTKALFDVFNLFKDSNNELIESILENCTICFVPMLNPDGAEVYTRHNANNIDLNRDAQNLSQPESNVLRSVFNEFKPDFCFNLHGQRTLFSAGKHDKSAVLSFLAPAQDVKYTISENRKIAMDLIYRIQSSLQITIPEQIGIYDDAFNQDCVGDTFQGLGVPTLLYEAGHFPCDYQRETTRELIFKSLFLGLDLISHATDLGKQHKFYFQIPQNEKLHRDIIIRNVLIDGEIKDIAIQYEELLNDNSIEFIPKINAIETKLKLFGHREIDADFAEIEAPSKLKVSNEIVYVTINNEKFSLFA